MSSETLFSETDKHGITIAAEWRKHYSPNTTAGGFCVVTYGAGETFRTYPNAESAIAAAKRKLASRNKES